MEVNRLLSDELTFELKCRGIDLGNGTVHEKRSLLREALHKEREGISAPTNVNFEPKSELNICSNKLDELLGNIQELNVANIDNEYKRIKSRLLHVEGRLNRISRADFEVETEQHKLSELCNDILRALEVKYTSTKRLDQQDNQDNNVVSNQSGAGASTSIIDQPNLLLPEIINSNHNNTINNSVSVEVENLIDIEPEAQIIQTPSERFTRIEAPPRVVENHNNLATRGDTFISMIDRLTQQFKTINGSNTSQVNVNSQPRRVQFSEHFEPPPQVLNSTSCELPHFSYTQSGKFVDVSRWKLTFDGTSSVTDFLERLEEMRISRNVSKTQLFNSISELLEGDAAVWYRFARVSIQNYDEFRDIFRSSFLPTNYEERIRDILKHRTQGASESVVIYVAHMENLFSKLISKPSEVSRVNFIKSKMLPHFQLSMAGKGVNTLQSLLSIGREIEEANVSAQEYHAPPINPRNSVEPGLEYRHLIRSRVTVVDSHDINTELVSEPSPIASASVNAVAPTVKCWNCGQQGHIRQACTQPPRKHCFRCGRQAVTIRTCPSCSGNGQPSH